MSKPASTPARRFMKLAGMTASIATKAVSNRIQSRNASEEEKATQRQQLLEQIGVQIADTLGEMKGAVMKVGQIASQYQDIFPPEIAKAMARLQRQAPPVPFATIQQQVEKELGKSLSSLFARFEQEPFAAASIGQVHRAVLHSGQPVVVKVQYPGVDECCESDLKQIRMALRLAGVLKIDRALQDELFREIETSLHEELDYTHEAHNLALFAAFHAPLDAQLVIPRVFPEFSSRRVLTLSEEKGDSIEQAAQYPLEVRNQIGQRLFSMMGQQIFFLRQFHCDPHPGNFAFRPDGSVVVYDFGCTKVLPESVAQHYRKLVSAARCNHIPDLETELRGLKVRTEQGQVPAEFYKQWLSLLLPPVNEPFDFAQSTLHHEAVKLGRKSLKYWDCFQPSGDTMMINRAVSGHYWNMVALKVQENFEPLVSRLVIAPLETHSTET